MHLWCIFGPVWWCLVVSGACLVESGGVWYFLHGMPRLHHYIKRKPRRHYAPLEQKIETWHLEYWSLADGDLQMCACQTRASVLGVILTLVLFIWDLQSLFIQTFSSQQDHLQTTFINGQLLSIDSAKEKSTERFYTVDQKRFHPKKKYTKKEHS